MNKNILYGLVFIVLFFALIFPNLINPTRGFIFTIDEWVVLLLFLLSIILFRNLVKKIIKKLNQKYSWESALRKRILVQAAIILLGATLLSAIIFYGPLIFLVCSFLVETMWNFITQEMNPQTLRQFLCSVWYVNDTWNFILPRLWGCILRHHITRKKPWSHLPVVQ